MKKLLLIAATSTALFTSTASFADENQPADVIANPNEHRFYLKFEGGASKLNTENFESCNAKIKSNNNGIFGLGSVIILRIVLEQS